jgi:hypothetical protein
MFSYAGSLFLLQIKLSTETQSYDPENLKGNYCNYKQSHVKKPQCVGDFYRSSELYARPCVS